jgi:outer membrane lipoprotein-sorting protein
MTVSGTIDLVQQGLSGTLTVCKKEPDKRRADIEMMGMLIIQAYDGQQAWGFNAQTMANEVKSGEEETQLKREALPIVSVLYPEKYGITYTYKGKENIQGKDYHVLEEAYADGFKATVYLDPETYLTYKVKAKISNPVLGDVDFEQFPTDYKKVDGMTIAHSITSFTGGAEYMKVTIKEVTFNKGIEDSFFKMK